MMTNVVFDVAVNFLIEELSSILAFTKLRQESGIEAKPSETGWNYNQNDGGNIAVSS